MNEERIKGIAFKSQADFRRWRFKLIRLYLGRLLALIFTTKNENIYAAFLLELQRTDKFEDVVKRYNSKIFKG